MKLLPGLALCAGLGLFAWTLSAGIFLLVGQHALDPLLAAILIGIAFGGWARRRAALAPGIAFSARQVLEIAVAVLGLTFSYSMLAGTGWALIGSIVAVVLISLAGGIAIARLCGVSPRLAVLLACGNSICGNSAIAAVAPAVRADPDDVAAAIAFNAVLAVLVVAALPLAIPLLSMTGEQYGVLAGLTVYAVPQVIAAASPAGTAAVKIGAAVKLVRVLMLGPVALLLSAIYGAEGDARRGLSLQRVVPWFIVLFLVFSALNSAGQVPEVIAGNALLAAKLLGTVAMAALGLLVDPMAIRRVSARVSVALVGAFAFLLALSLSAIFLFGLGGGPAPFVP